MTQVFECNTAESSPHDTREPVIEVREASYFLIDRLHELEIGWDDEEAYREFVGHVLPAIGRLRSALRAPSNTPTSQSLIAEQAERDDWITTLQRERDAYRLELMKLATVMEPHWKGAGQKLEADWMIKLYCQAGEDLDQVADERDALQQQCDTMRDGLRQRDALLQRVASQSKAARAYADEQAKPDDNPIGSLFQVQVSHFEDISREYRVLSASAATGKKG